MYYYRINFMAGSLATLLITLVLGLLIFLRGRGGNIARSYFLFMLSIAAFSFGMYIFTILQHSKYVIFWARFCHAGASLIPAFYFHFVIKLIKLDTKQKPLIRTGYIFTAIFALLSFTPYLVKSVSYKLGFNFTDAGYLYPFFMVYFVFYPAYSHYLSFKVYSSLSNLGKRQLKYITVAGIAALMGSIMVFFTVYGINIPIAGPLALYLVAAANLFVAVATYTTRLMDVELIKRRTLIFNLLYGVSVGTFVALVFIARRILSAYFNLNQWILPVAALFIITIFIRPLENLLAKVTDRVLYQRRYDYMSTLKNVAKGMTLVTDTDRLLKLMVRFISKEVRVTGCAVYIFNKGNNTYVREVTRGFYGKNPANSIDADCPLAEWLIEKKEPLSHDNVLSWIQGERLFAQRIVLKRTLEQIRVAMKNLDGSLCVPSFLRGEMTGFLVLGAKLSGDRYTMDDMSLLSTLSNNAAIALENARMYEELKARIDKLRQLYKEEHTLFLDAASAFSYAIDAKDGYTHAHALKVSNYSVATTKELEKLLPYINFTNSFYDSLKIASLLHDVGKIGIPDSILKKKGKLTKKEEEKLKEHAVIGGKILSPIREIGEVFNLIRHHHENFDGSGFPDGLKGNDIPMISRIIAVINAFDTMTSDRPHRKAIKKQDALKEIKDKAGTQFDPVIVEAFSKAINKPENTQEA